VRFASGTIVVACIAAAATFGAGCSFLVSFDDQPSCDGGLCAVDASVGIDAVADGAVDSAGDGAKDGGRDAPADALPPNYAPCKGLNAGSYCANDGPDAYAGPKSDLLNCDGGKIYAVKPCGDAGCLAMPNPFPDCCNECPTKQNGTYCGRDFAGFPAANADILVGCQLGNAVQVFACPHGCKSSSNAASCYP
jgi:hypothetical protein